MASEKNNSKKSKNQLRRERQKLLKSQAATNNHIADLKKNISIKQITNDFNKNNGIEQLVVEAAKNDLSNANTVVPVDMDMYLNDPNFQDFKKVLNRYHMPIKNDKQSTNIEDQQVIYSDDEDANSLAKDSKNKKSSNQLINRKINKNTNLTDSGKLSNRQLRKLNKIPLSVLKTYSKRPERVEWYDADSPYPFLLTYLKLSGGVGFSELGVSMIKKSSPSASISINCSYIDVPSHWQFKRGYLTSRKGREKPPYELPHYIKEAATTLKDPLEAGLTDDINLKKQSRERVQPKMNKVDLDYEKLHDAFFKFQEKPALLKIGDLYYEGRENDEINVRKFKPGVITESLKNALGIPSNSTTFHFEYENLPWINRMRVFGCPKSYPWMIIKGINDSGSLDRKNLQVEELKRVEILNSMNSLIVPIEENHWGDLKAIEEDDDDDSGEDEEENNGEEEGEQQEELSEQASPGNDYEGIQEDVTVVPISSFGGVDSTNYNNSNDIQNQQNESNNKKRLYHVLKENTNDVSERSSESRMGDKTYNLNIEENKNDENEYSKRQRIYTENSFIKHEARLKQRKQEYELSKQENHGFEF